MRFAGGRMLTVITPTSDRPLAVQLCAHQMTRQTITEPVEWVIADDGTSHVDTPGPPGPNWTVRHIRCAPLAAGKPRVWSFLGNLRAAFAAASHDKIAIVEDDDWYASDWLAWCVAQLGEDCAIVGESHSRYYDIQRRRYRQLHNVNHASLCSTAVTGRLRDWFEMRTDPTRRADWKVDIDLWRCNVPKKLYRGNRVVGLKCLPGSRGLGSGHGRMSATMTADPDGRVLRQWIGDAADQYLTLHKDGA